jgi:hypothetical protein
MTARRSIARRTFIAGAVPAFCAGCGNTPLSNAPQAFRSLFSSGADLNVTREDIGRIPYASIAVRLGKGPQALLVLGRDDGRDLDWVSAKHEVIVTRNGRIVKTFGLTEDVKATEFLSDDPLSAAPDGTPTQSECLRAVDFEPSHFDGVLLRSQFHALGDEDVAILGSHISTRVWEETGEAPQFDWQFTNQYWLDAHSGFVWKSRQHTAPGLPALEITVFRRPLENG